MTAAVTKAPLLGTVFYLALIVPLEFSVTVAGLRLSPYRVFLLVMFLPMVLRLVREHRVLPADYLLASHALWAALALGIYGGFAAGLESGGIYVVESFGAYLVGRLAVSSPESSRAMLRFMITALLVMAVFALPESITGYHLIREVSRAIMGGAALPVIDPRMGLHRAFGSFDHPILYGVFAASTFAAAYYVLCKERLQFRSLAILGIIAGSTFISLSAGPFVAITCQGLVLGWDRFTKGIQTRWSILVGGLALIWLAVSLVSNRGFIKVFISYFTFSPQSAYNRTLIWDYGTAEVARHPVFGIGLGDWIRAPWMSDSMDNFWLLTAVRYGLPALIFLVLAIVLIAIEQARAVRGNTEMNRFRMGWLAMIVGLSVSGMTVHFWNAMFTYFFFLIGTGVWMTKPVIKLPKILLVAQLAALVQQSASAKQTQGQELWTSQ
jgi:hypothetical protein